MAVVLCDPPMMASIADRDSCAILTPDRTVLPLLVIRVSISRADEALRSASLLTVA
jgi:hypothetical protein